MPDDRPSKKEMRSKALQQAFSKMEDELEFLCGKDTGQVREFLVSLEGYLDARDAAKHPKPE